MRTENAGPDGSELSEWLGAADEAQRLTELESLQNDLALAQFAGEAGQMHLGALVDELRGERGVMLGLLRELLSVVKTIEPDCDSEAF